MPRPGITKQEVAHAVGALRAEGRPTTTRVVRLQLGRGSYATISRYLEELRAKSDAKPVELPALPDDVQLALAESVYAMWQAMSKASRSEEAKVKLQHEQHVRALTVELNRQRETLQRLERELYSALSDCAALKARNEALELEHAGLRERLATEQALLRRSERERELLLERLWSNASTRKRSAPRRAKHVQVTQARKRA